MIAQHYAIRTEYMPGIAGEEIFAGKDPRETALYAIVGEKRPSNAETGGHPSIIK